jgi:serine/threonine protein phosphatase PrpC
MLVTVSCSNCLTPCKVDEKYVGRAVKCPKCGKPFTAEMSSDEDILPEFDVEPEAAAREQADIGPPRLDIGCATSAGRVRTRNEDSFLVMHRTWSNLSERHELAVLLIADGMGGYDAGDQASGLAIRAFGASLTPLLTNGLGGKLQNQPAASLSSAITAGLQEANRQVFEKATKDPNCKGMGATAAALLIWDDVAVIGHVGDCRVYYFHDGKLTQITKDQTLVARMVELGTLSAKEALTHPNRNEVTQALGRRPDLAPSSHKQGLAKGDWLLVACDGLPAHLDGPDLEAEMKKAEPSAVAQANRLVSLTNERGGSDNCTVIAVRCV